jgi:predicted CxxxxCH...CXXCH cytochrome family protein
VVAANLTFVNPALHINGLVEISGAACGTCHGNVNDGPAPPVDTQGNSDTALVTVGAHQAHLNGGAWHRPVQCTDCHVVPTALDQPGHIDAAPAEVIFGAIVSADGAQPSWDRVATTCDGAYCHGATLLGPNAGGTVARDPSWTTVDGTGAECGTTCHTTPPGGGHPDSTTCEACHGEVISHFDPVSPELSTWAAPERHIDGVVDGSGYHDLGGWTSPRDGQEHHGSQYFLQNQQRDEHDTGCTACHGANLDGGTSGVSCDNAGCHGGDWRSCTFCHGTGPAQINPPVGVGGETTILALAVGRHAAHLSASATHVAFTCETCHAIPGAGDVSHALGYVASTSLATPGHHGDVTFGGRATGMTFDVNATQGAAPVSARGTCTGACHSNGNGGPPAVTPYWAGGGWLAGSCGSCHAAIPTSGEHPEHTADLACGTCHPAASGATHVNGVKDTSFAGAFVFTPSSGACLGRPSCTGICHGRGHEGDCW